MTPTERLHTAPDREQTAMAYGDACRLITSTLDAQPFTHRSVAVSLLLRTVALHLCFEKGPEEAEAELRRAADDMARLIR